MYVSHTQKFKKPHSAFVHLYTTHQRQYCGLALGWMSKEYKFDSGCELHISYTKTFRAAPGPSQPLFNGTRYWASYLTSRSSECRCSKSLEVNHHSPHALVACTIVPLITKVRLRTFVCMLAAVTRLIDAINTLRCTALQQLGAREDMFYALFHASAPK